MSGRRRSVGAVASLLLIVLGVADLGGLVDTRAMAAGAADLGAAGAVGVLDGYDAVLARHVPGPPKPRRKRKPKAAATRPSSSPPAAAAPSRAAPAGIPSNYRRWYQQAGAQYRVDWRDLAGIGLVESDHGRSRAPGVRSGVNRFGCCAGPMQFNLRNGPPSTWAQYGRGNIYDPADAIPAAARLLRANSYGDPVARPGFRRCPGIRAAPGTVNALRHYNNACWYVAQVLGAY